MTNDNQHIPSGYKPSPLGIVPEDWEVKRLGEVCNFLDSQRVPIKDGDRVKMQGKYPYYGASGIIDYVNDYLFDDDLILLGEDGANILTRSTPLAFLVSGKVWVNNHAHVLKTSTNHNRYYICNYLESLSYDKYNTGTAQPKLNREICENIPILLPNIYEQNKIADILQLWDTAIAKQTALIEQLTLRKRGLMQQLLTGKKRLKGFEEEWKEIKLGEILRESTVAATESKVEKRITVRLNLQGIEQREVRGTEEKDATMYFVRKQGQFIYGKQNLHKGAFGIIPKELDGYESSSDIPAFDFIGNVIPKYFYYYMCLIYGSLESIATGTGSKRIQPKNLLKKSYLFPSLNEQQILSDIFNHLDYEIKLHNNKLSSLQSQKRGLMQQLLTGRKRIIG